ncbi:aminopeptidase P family protein [Puteibacter caeruleilacunae]|nr:aminopeptidase P family protein [Puteibacter caeruleilacunae]
MNTTNNIVARIDQLRTIMRARNIGAVLINGADPHLSEYVSERYETRAFISGFTGSAGLVVVTLEQAGLWTDSRYFIQAEQQLQGTGIELFKMRMPGTPDPESWVAEQINSDQKIAIDGKCLSLNAYRKLQEATSSEIIDADLLEEVWIDRPSMPQQKAFELSIEYCGESRKSKIERIQKTLIEKNASCQIISALDEIAWTFNLRGTDIQFNPVWIAYAVVGQQATYLFCEDAKLDDQLKTELTEEGITILPYEQIYTTDWIPEEIKSFYIDPDRTNYSVYRTIQSDYTVIEGISQPCLFKAQKNEVEISNFHKAMAKDGAALVNFMYWLQKQMQQDDSISEYDVRLQLQKFRAEQDNYQGESFYPIVGYAGNGAIVHYHVEESSAATIQNKGLLLIDSGGQYLQGTTDITRTFAVGPVSDEEKHHFTLVLKGMISLTQAQFPENTKGYHIDILARQALWQNQLNYGHGTGHGIGHFLNVHEGPMSIRQEFNEHTLKPGMVMSNEPGFYKEGAYGIRIENVIACKENGSSDYGNFLAFDTLTLCPIDLTCIQQELLSKSEIQWLNEYHKKVYDTLNPLLEQEQKEFLSELTKAI